jgi:hypothetical protein
MTSTSRLILLCAAMAAMLGTALPAEAQAGGAAGAKGEPPVPPPSSAESGADQPPANEPERRRSAPTGCPYRDGKLDLIV